MMYIAVYPIAVSIRSTNVYEEKSMGASSFLLLSAAAQLTSFRQACLRARTTRTRWRPGSIVRRRKR